MSKKKICFIAQFPPPIHGLSKAVETLYNSELNDEFEFEKIDITDNKKILSNLFAIRNSKADMFYFTISQTRGGNLRDLIIFKMIGKRLCLVHLHGGYYRKLVEEVLPIWQKKANYRAISKIGGVIVLGPSLKWIFEGMISDNKVYTVPNCVDDEYVISEKKYQKKISELSYRDMKHVLYLSNFIVTKGYRDVLEMALLEKKRVSSGGLKKFHFDFAGAFFDKREEEFFWGYIKDNHLDDYVTYHGVVDGEDKKKLLEICDIFCLLTRYPNEGQPISIIEAMSNGMVIVTTNHAGIPDLVSNGENGIVVDANSEDVSSIYEMVVNFKDFEQVEKHNRECAMRLYSQKEYIVQMRECFRKVGEL